ncbi:alpha-2B adrenergic receptor-like [Littorina saxatilis]|uniref:G-protein coupled receptors family 1 profile domain-containing protein n=1 Tax=Littorina saxatilis TaxID=31220 RepID=A0AAN9BA94_9CAEN
MFALWTPAFVVDRLNNSTPGECFYDPEKNQTFVTIVAVFGYHGSTVVMLFCYIKVFMFVRRRSKVGPLRRRNNGPDADTTLRDTAVSNGPSLQPTTNIPREGLSGDVMELDDDNKSNPYVTAVSTNQGTAEKGTGSMEIQTTISVVQESSSRGHFLHPDAAKSEKEQKPKQLSADTNTGQARDNNQTRDHSVSCIGQNNQQSDSDNIQSQITAVPQRASYQQSSISSNMKTALRREQKVFRTLTYVVVGYLICWMPFHVSFDVMAIDRTLVPERFYDVTYWLAYCNSAINPFLYNFSSPDFHRAFKRLMGRR